MLQRSYGENLPEHRVHTLTLLSEQSPAASGAALTAPGRTQGRSLCLRRTGGFGWWHSQGDVQGLSGTLLSQALLAGTGTPAVDSGF